MLNNWIWESIKRFVNKCNSKLSPALPTELLPLRLIQAPFDFPRHVPFKV
ncbi:14052_t:CDS:2 [Acaulospora morrowiae]|uniref:14052_t:CDS:1 n=1 Tax=Acaulospora morrowiae TaxID=94023 RepID=A0A9N8ZU10_9GLOM|nr:14052_t:CDS:2 [Acaulospora morrowiae]